MRLIKLPEVVRMTSIPASSIYWRISRNEFPRPIKIGARASAWELEAVEAWMREKLAAARDGAAVVVPIKGRPE